MTVLRVLPNVPSAMPIPTRRMPGVRITARWPAERIHWPTRPAGEP